MSRKRVGLLARKVFVDGSLGDIFWVSGGLHTRTHDLPNFAKGQVYKLPVMPRIDRFIDRPSVLL